MYRTLLRLTLMSALLLLPAAMATAQGPGPGGPPPGMPGGPGPGGPPPGMPGGPGMGGPHHHGGGPGAHPDMLARVLEKNAERLKLDPAVLDKIRTIADASHDESRATHDQMRLLHDQMRALLDADKPDEAAVMAQADKIGAAKTAAAKRRLRTMLDIRALLTPKQRRELVKIHEEMRAEMRGKNPGWRRDGWQQRDSDEPDVETPNDN